MKKSELLTEKSHPLGTKVGWVDELTVCFLYVEELGGGGIALSIWGQVGFVENT